MPSKATKSPKRRTIGKDSSLGMHTRLPDNHECYAMVGQVASEWSFLELILDSTISEMIEWKLGGIVLPAPAIACVTSQIMGVGPRCRAIVSLAHYLGMDEQKVQKPYRVFMGASYVIAEERARFVHDPWYIATDTKSPAQMRSMPNSDPRYGFFTVNKDDFAQTLSDISNLQHRASILSAAVQSELIACADRRALVSRANHPPTTPTTPANPRNNRSPRRSSRQ